MRQTVGRGEAGLPLIDFLAVRLAVSKRQAKDLLNARLVLVNRRRIWMARHPLRPGDAVEILPGAPVKPHSSLDVLYEDEDYLVADKRPGMLSNGPHSAESLLQAVCRNRALAAVHRLDRDTSGCLLFAKSPEAFEKAVAVFRQRQVRKAYHVIAVGRVEPPVQTVTVPIDGESAVTRIRTLDANRQACHLLVEIDTGRTHQIRRHLDLLGHPVVGDRHYGTAQAVSDRAVHAGRQMLHASTLELKHPATGRRLFAKAPLPRDFRTCLVAFHLT